jgi:predicted flap endonuclease-1-like 5' DNA nuclease
VEVRKKLTEFESTMAILIGGGLTLIMMAFLLSAAQGARANEGFFTIMLLIGAVLMVLGTVVWFLGGRVWTKRDDWSEPLYTGHEHDHHDDHAADHAEAHHDEHGHPIVAAVNPNPAGAPAAHAPAESAPVAAVAEHNAVIPAPPAEVMPSAPRAVVPAAAEVAEPPAHAADPNAAPLKAVAPESVSALAEETPASPYTEGEPIAPEDAVTPATEPTSEAPTAEAPVAEAPVAEAPTAEAPTAEAPAAEAPVAEAPVAEAPAAEAPVAEAPANPYQLGERVAPPEAITPATEPTSEAPAAEAAVPEAPAAEAPISGAPVPEAPAAEAAVPEAAASDLSATRPDDLTLIEGIGPKIAAALVSAGVTTFARIAEMAPADLEAIVRGAGVRMVGKSESWPVQARLAADGKLAELKTLQDKLKGGQLPTE